MKRVRHAPRYLSWIVASVIFSGCSEHEGVGGGYVLETPPTLGPDQHPGTSLRWKGKTVWNNVYVGYFSPHDATKFSHDGMFVFVGPVPGNTDWWNQGQLFAVRGEGSPVVLSERLVGQPLVVSSDMREMSTFGVIELAPIDGGIRVAFEYQIDRSREARKTNELTWADVGKLLDEAESSARTVHHKLGVYRVLPVQ